MRGKRLIDIGSMTTQMAAKEISHLTAQLFLSKEKKEEKKQATQEQIAEIIFSKIGQMRGTGLKLLQVLSLDEELLPHPYIEKFESSYGQAPPLSRAVVKKVFKNEFQNSPEDIFKEFNYNPLAAASLGQVHDAVLRTGEKVVVKIQYPNISENIKTDIGFIKAISKVIGNTLIKKSIEELSKNLSSEIDYNLEAENLLLFQGIKKSTRIVLPHFFSEFSSKTIITLGKLEGTPLYQVTDQKLIHQALQDIFDFFFISLKEQRCIHADPHPGNFIISQNHTGVIDFGSIKKDLSQDTVDLFIFLLDSNANEIKIVDLYKKLGANISIDYKEFFENHVRSYHQLCTQLIGHKSIDFSNKRDVVANLRKELFLQSKSPYLQNLSSEFTLLHKSFQSLLFMLCKYKAHINTEKIFKNN